MFGMTRAQIIHGLMALGSGLGVFMYEAITISSNPWVDAACYAGIAILGALGVGIAKRSAP